MASFPNLITFPGSLRLPVAADSQRSRDRAEIRASVCRAPKTLPSHIFAEVKSGVMSSLAGGRDFRRAARACEEGSSRRLTSEVTLMRECWERRRLSRRKIRKQPLKGRRGEDQAGLRGRVEGIPATGELACAPPVAGEVCDVVQRGPCQRKI